MNPIWLLMLAIGIVGSNSLVLSPIANDVAQSFADAKATDVMVASAAYGAGTAISALILAPRADMFGLRRSLLWAVGGLAVALAVCAMSVSTHMLITAQAAAGLCAGVALPATYGLAADIGPLGRQSETLGKVLTGWTLSLVLGVSLSAMLSDFVHWRIVFVVLAIGAGTVCLLISRSLFDREDVRSVAVTSPLRVLALPGVLQLIFSVVAYMVAFYGLYAYLGSHLTVTLNFSTAFAGVSALAYGIGFGAVAPLDRLIDRFGVRQTAPVIFAMLAAAYALLGLSSALWIALLSACVLWGAMNHLGLNILVGQLTSIDPTQRASIMGLYSAVTYGAMFVGTALFKPVFEAHGFQVAAYLSALCVLPALAQSLLPFLKQALRSNSV